MGSRSPGPVEQPAQIDVRNAGLQRAGGHRQVERGQQKLPEDRAALPGPASAATSAAPETSGRSAERWWAQTGRRPRCRNTSGSRRRPGSRCNGNNTPRTIPDTARRSAGLFAHCLFGNIRTARSAGRRCPGDIGRALPDCGALRPRLPWPQPAHRDEQPCRSPSPRTEPYQDFGEHPARWWIGAPLIRSRRSPG